MMLGLALTITLLITLLTGVVSVSVKGTAVCFTVPDFNFNLSRPPDPSSRFSGDAALVLFFLLVSSLVY